MKHYVMSDIHGMGELFDEVMKFLNEQPDGYQLIFLGDACDRGPDGYRIMNALLSNPNVIYLQGNHEDLFVNAACELVQTAQNEGLSIKELITACGGLRSYMTYGYDVSLYAYNGGFPTFKDWVDDGAKMSFVSKIRNLPLYYCLNDKIDLFHAGGLACHLEQMDKSRMLWNRDHFPFKWDYGDGNRLLIHGHTPVKYVYDEITEEVPRVWKPLRYSENKICMDTAAFKTNTIGLYCVEDDEFIMITDHDELPTF